METGIPLLPSSAVFLSPLITLAILPALANEKENEVDKVDEVYDFGRTSLPVTSFPEELERWDCCFWTPLVRPFVPTHIFRTFSM